MTSASRQLVARSPLLSRRFVMAMREMICSKAGCEFLHCAAYACGAVVHSTDPFNLKSMRQPLPTPTRHCAETLLRYVDSSAAELSWATVLKCSASESVQPDASCASDRVCTKVCVVGMGGWRWGGRGGSLRLNHYPTILNAGKRLSVGCSCGHVAKVIVYPRCRAAFLTCR